jgi:2'-5' RNA ligase
MFGMADGQQTSGMIALIPRQEDAQGLTVSGGLPLEEIHLTLIYLGDDVTDWTARQRAEDVISAGIASIDLPPIQAQVFGHGLFNPDDTEREPCSVYLVGASPVLTPLHEALSEHAAAEQHDPWIPHVTAGYSLADSTLNYTGPITFDRVRVALADQIIDYPLGDTEEIKTIMTGLETKREISVDRRKQLATSGKAMPDGSYPIEHVGDLKNAVTAYGRAPKDKRPALKAHIMKHAKRLNAMNMVPGDWKGGTSSEAKALAEMFAAALDFEVKLESPDPRAAKLRNYWAHDPKGVAKWRPGQPGDYMRLVRQLRKYVKDPHILKGLAANIHKEAIGVWPGREHGHKAVLDWIDGAELEVKHAEMVDASALIAEMKAASDNLRRALDPDDDGDDDSNPATDTDDDAGSDPDGDGDDDSNPATDTDDDADGPDSEEDAAEQALFDDVDWDLNPDGTLSDSGDDADTDDADGLDSSGNLDETSDQDGDSEGDDDGDGDGDDLFALLMRGKLNATA